MAPPARRERQRARRAPVRPSGTTGLTTRAFVLALVVCALVVSAALPLRDLLGQRARIAELQQVQTAQRARVVALEDQRRLLEDPDHLARLARERLQYVRPGETAYVVLAPEQPPAAPVPGEVPAPAGPQAPWYSQLWGSVQSADRPVELAPPAESR